MNQWQAEQVLRGQAAQQQAAAAAALHAARARYAQEQMRQLAPQQQMQQQQQRFNYAGQSVPHYTMSQMKQQQQPLTQQQYYQPHVMRNWSAPPPAAPSQPHAPHSYQHAPNLASEPTSVEGNSVARLQLPPAALKPGNTLGLGAPGPLQERLRAQEERHLRTGLIEGFFTPEPVAAAAGIDRVSARADLEALLRASQEALARESELHAALVRKLEAAERDLANADAKLCAVASEAEMEQVRLAYEQAHPRFRLAPNTILKKVAAPVEAAPPKELLVL